METGYSKWRKLDNAAIAFPLVSGRNDSRVFRFYCQLKEEVDPDILQSALDQTMEKYPLFQAVLRKGLFWFYLESREIKALVKPERKPPCSQLYIPDQKSLLFRVSYHKNRINFEVYHALTDGTGAMNFITELVQDYLILAHPEVELPRIEMADEATPGEKEEDSFSQYYSSKIPKNKEKKPPAVQLKGEKLVHSDMQITEVIFSVKEILAKARSYGVSITIFLTAILLCAIHEEIPKNRQKRPITLMIPVNLRNYFPSQSMANFFGWIEISCYFQPETTFKDILESVKEQFKKELSRDVIAAKLNDLVSLEKNPVLRLVPLEIKTPFLLAGTTLGGRSITAIYSNVGIIRMPEEYREYIQRFGLFASTDSLQLCSCSFGDEMVLSFTSKIPNGNIERNFMEKLKEEQVSCEIRENDFPGQKEQPHGTAKLGLKIFSFTCIAAVVLCWMMNFLATPQMWWAGYATAGVFCAWLLIRVGYQKRKNPLKNSMWQLIFIMIGAILWDYATGWIGWSVDFAIPLAVLLNGATMQILARAYKMEVSEYLFYLMQSGAAGIVPAILWLTGTVRITWPSVICVGLSVLYLIGLFFFRGKDFMREMQKKFRV